MSKAEEGSVEPAETFCITNLPHVLLQDGVGTQQMSLRSGVSSDGCQL